MKKQYRQSNQAGFSIVEVLMTLFIFGVMLVLFQSTSQSLVINRHGRFKEVALRIADQKLQTMRTTAFATIPGSGTFSDPLLATIPNGAGTVTVTDESARLKRVVVVVSWRSPQGPGTQQVQLDTYIAQGGLGQ